MARKGLPKAIVKKYGVTKKAWAVYRGRHSKSKASKPKTNKTKVRSSSMGKKKTRRSRGLTLPIAPLAGLAVGLAEPIIVAKGGDWIGAAGCMDRYIGYNVRERRFNLGALMHGVVPLAVGILVHKYIGGKPLNANQVLARSGVPVIRV